MSVLLIGAPNSGKTTLFNRLTGHRARTVNYPGSTVEMLVGHVLDTADSPLHSPVEVVDSPGIYSLHPRSPDESMTEQSILNRPWARIVCVLDATQLARQLAIVRQLRLGFAKLGVSSEEFSKRVMIALTMSDLILDGGRNLNLGIVERELGVKVVVVPFQNEALRSSDLWKWLIEARTLDPIQWPDRNALLLPDRNVFPSLDLKDSKRLKDLVFGQLAPNVQARDVTRRIDRIALHPYMGLAIFTGVMATLFSFIFWVAQPLMEIFESVFSLASQAVLSFSFVDPEHPLTRLLADGILAGAGSVAVFVPQIFVLFVGLVLLEDSGYLARAATIVDQPLKKVGLGGRSFVPLLSGFACAIPAMLASRSINSRLERLSAMFAIPLMSCSARLPVYALLLAFLFPNQPLLASLVLTGLYLGGLVSGVIAAGILSRFMERREPGLLARSFLALELPIYRRPRFRNTLLQASLRTKSYIKRTGPLIVLLSVLIWGGTNFPHFHSQDATDRLENSYAGQIGRFLSPIFEPMGGDWRTGLGLISAFAAREVFVSSMAVIFHVTGDTEEQLQQGLLNEMRTARTESGSALFTPASVAGLLVFFAIAMQCLSTFAISTKESGSLKFAVVQLVTFNAVAYGFAVIVVQVMRGIGIP